MPAGSWWSYLRLHTDERTNEMAPVIETTTLLELINLCMAVAAGAYLLWWLYGDPGRK